MAEAWARRVTEAINSLHPDIVFLVGDYVYHDAENVIQLVSMSEIRSPYGVYFVTGNHDYLTGDTDYIREMMFRFGAHELQNETINVDVDGKTFTLAGISDLWFEADIPDSCGHTSLVLMQLATSLIYSLKFRSTA